MELTIHIIKETLIENFSQKSIEKFVKFLEISNAEDRYYNAICRTYNSDVDPIWSFTNDVRCSYEDESELGSCFIDFSNSLEGREFWEEFNESW